MILIDDANKNYLPPNAPSYVDVPNIERIYKEGALFTNYYDVSPMCNPSRYSLLTGVYPHVHGAIDNTTHVTNASLPFFTSILQSAGYHNLCIGKFTNVDEKPASFEKKMCMHKIDYIDPIFNFSGVRKTIYGNATRIINDTMKKWIAKVDTPFFAWIGHIAPHSPVKLLQQDQSVYKLEHIDLPANVGFFEDDYPSFLYSDHAHFISDTIKIKNLIEKEYEALLEIDRGIGDLFDTLTKRGLLDNTLIVFTNDNGAFYGEHNLTDKGKPYEAAVSMPLFIRYPAWFNTTTTSKYSQLLESFDLTPTFLSAAGIDPNPYHFQGIPIKKQLGKKAQHRNTLFFERIQIENREVELVGEKTAPSWRGIRTVNYKYVRYHCDSLVEELFDMKNDSLETANLARNSNYSTALNNMRLLLDSMIVITHDTLSSDTVIGDCYLIDNITNQRIAAEVPFEVVALPQPASDYVHLNVFTGDGPYGNKSIRIELLNQLGTVINTWNFAPADGLTMTLDVRDLPQGLYLIRTVRGDKSHTIPLLIQ